MYDHVVSGLSKLVLVTGSSDFGRTVLSLKKMGIEVHIVGMQNRVGKDLAEAIGRGNIINIDSLFPYISG